MFLLVRRRLGLSGAKSVDEFARFGGLHEVRKDAFDGLGGHNHGIWYPESSQLHRALHNLEE